MLNLNIIKGTKVYQEAKLEGKQQGKLEGKQEGKLEAKLEMVPKLLEKDLSIQEIAELLELDDEIVREAIEL